MKLSEILKTMNGNWREKSIFEEAFERAQKEIDEVFKGINREKDIICLKGGIEYIPAGKGPNCSHMKDVSPTTGSEI